MPLMLLEDPFAFIVFFKLFSNFELEHVVSECACACTTHSLTPDTYLHRPHRDVPTADPGPVPHTTGAQAAR
ncbi:hypothetical protein LUU34_01176500 [Aix galericulata]|nr:hypothetical protein LUU34_01176500 [Aix galericulata]